MLTTKPIQRRYGGNICRDCINQEYEVRLSRKDCLYNSMEECPCCHIPHHPVVGFRLSGIGKMFFKR